MRVRLSWGSCSLGHNYVGCPFSSACFLAVARAGRGSPDPRRCRPQGSCPSRRFRLARGSHGVFGTPPIAVAPNASRPSFMPLASLELPSRAFPSRGAVPALAGRLLPCGFALRPPPAQCLREIHGRFLRFAPALRRSRPPEGRRGTHEPGRRFLAVASPVASTRSKACRTCRPLPTDTGLAGKRPARPLRSFAPPGSPFSDDLSAWPGSRSPVGALLGFSSFRACSTTVRGSVTRVDARGGQSPLPRTPPGAQSSRLHAATRTPTPELASPGSVDTQGL